MEANNQFKLPQTKYYRLTDAINRDTCKNLAVVTHLSGTTVSTGLTDLNTNKRATNMLVNRHFSITVF